MSVMWIDDVDLSNHNSADNGGPNKLIICCQKMEEKHLFEIDFSFV